MTPPPQSPKSRGFGLLVTNIAKLAGVILGLKAGLQDHPDGRVIALAALMVAGVQGLETLLDRLLGK